MDIIRQHFEKEAPDFDRLILMGIPDYPCLVQALVAALPFEKTAPISLIDLGCGTGTVAEGVLDAFPNAHITCLDLAENMITMAQAKLAPHRNVRYIVGSFTTFDGEYDAVVSSLALHHLTTDDDKRCLYGRIYDRLRPGGVFYNGDIVLASSDSLQTMYMHQWRAFMRHNISEEAIESKWIPAYEAEDHPARLLDQLAWLTGIGFADVDVLWKYYNFAVYGGTKR
jgi:tRNA (cmo5U34)-methyltransferase